MTTDTYKSLQRRMIVYFLIVLGIASIFLMMFITMISRNVALYASKGILESRGFYHYYFHHSWKVNSILFAIMIVGILYGFIHSYFKVLNTLLAVLSGKQIKYKSIYFKLFPQLRIAQSQIELYLKKIIETEQLFVESSDQRNELLMYLAHDLKTPLTSMIGYMNYILDHQLSEEEQNNSIHIAMNKAQRLNLLIDEFSQLLLYDEKVNDLNKTKIDLNILLDYHLSGFIPLLPKKNLILNSDIKKSLYVMGDYDKLLRVFDNLMRNAMNYANKDSMIEVKAYQNANQIIIQYSNDSDSLNEEALKHLFDKFYRQEVARTSVSGGAGLGLAIAKAIIEAHEGSIEASLNQQRITFTITLRGEFDG